MRNTTAAQVGRAIRSARRKAGLTQAELGEFVGGAHRHAIAALERGEVTQQLERFFAIADALGLDVELRPRTTRLATQAEQ
jgi:DNA-binding XRE family transcriptional regulator